MSDELEQRTLEDLDQHDSHLRAHMTRLALLKQIGVAGAGLALGGGLARSASAGELLRRVSAASSLTLRVGGFQGVTAQGYVNEPLVTLNPSYQLTPCLAESWSQPTTSKIVLKLRDGVRFSDGSLLTPDDVIYSFVRNLDPALAGTSVSYNYGEMKSVHQTGRNEITIQLKAPDLFWVFGALVGTPIYKKSFAKPLGTKLNTSVHTSLGTGPYVLDSLTTAGSSAHRNPHYWGKRGVVDRIQRVIVAGPDTLYLAMQNGSVDMAMGLSALDGQRFANIPGVSVTGALAYESFLSFDVTRAPFNDIHVRRAIAHCWDARGFDSGTLHGLAIPANGPIFPWQWNNLMSPAERRAYFKTLPTYGFDLSKAKAELAKSSVPKGFSIDTVTTNLFPDAPLAMQALAANLSKIGIKVNFDVLDAGQWINDLLSKKYAFNHVYFGPDYADPYDNLASLLTTGGFNFANYQDATVNRLVKAQAASTNKAFRLKALKQIYAKLATDLPYFGLYWDDSLLAVRSPFKLTNNALITAEPWWRYIRTS